MKVKPLIEKKPIIVIGVAYVLLVAARFVLALLTSAYPMNNIDEFLYYSMARSIASGEGLLFRGQSADYVYILFSLILSPIYLFFGNASHIYRVLQLWTIILMNLTIFPLYMLNRRIVGKEKKAVGLTLFLMLFPDFILGEMILSEAILYPMFFSMIALVCAYLNKRKLSQMLGIGILSGLLYATKPGYIVAPIVAIVVCMVLALQERSKREAIQAVVGLSVMAGTIALMYAAAYGLGYHSGALSVYDEQLSATHVDAFLKAAVKYPYYFMLACGVIAFVLPLKLYPDMNRATKALFIITASALTGVILGTALVVNGYEYATNTVHMRYVGPYVMLFLLFSHADTGEKIKRIQEKGKGWNDIFSYAAIAFVIVCSIVLGCGTGTDSGTLPIANLSLAILHKAFLPSGKTELSSVIVMGLCVLTAFELKKCRFIRVRRICMMTMAVLFLLNNIAGYSLIRKDTVFSRVEESQEIAKKIGDREYLYICTSERLLNNASLDVNSKMNTNYIELNDLFNHTYETNGIYEPFIPWDMRGRISDRLTPETDIFVMEPTAFSMLELSDETQCISTPSKDLFMVTFSEGERWLDSMIANVKLNKLEAGDKGVLVIYDDAVLGHKLTVRMEIGVKQDVRMEFYSNSEIKQMDIKSGRGWYEVVFEHPESAYNFVCDEIDLNIYQYEIAE